MQFTASKLDGAWIIDVQRFDDERGFFARTWCKKTLAERGLDTGAEQMGIAFNTHKHTLRGMHYQADPHAETKFVRCTQGVIWDCIIDLRPGSPTFRQWDAVELSALNRRTFYVPKGFAHGYLTLTENAEVTYLMTTAYEPGAGRGVRWDDPAFGIDWPAKPAVINDRDATYGDFRPNRVAGQRG
ncbi:MAG: dTDP-4-dehydrorhamnose 3,5-epimerase [Planctomycetota bacterium]